ncbi:carboxylesterase family protein [Mycobacterium sp. WUMAC-067]|uniref:carboxylesterase/lipase family protein n=1 Tax=unclassified Mycobacterium TaxID=2642494 RepID=UPI001CD9E42D|nr:MULTISPECIES: carboxylesterase family protein [unclassified Mycobacterium]MCA2241999.1 carboxylesterase family protein [Mycobacterium sp. WUMAC-067]MCA2314483.1 carboxylesterase family protein [Mycobacterium sp. WUMAC-025]
MTRNVRTAQGLVSGAEEGGIHRFLGIPYAAPPVGALRWAPPAPPAPWDGVRDATRFGNAAIQTVDTGFDPGAPQSEDCLYLNVWTSTLDSVARQPVMVWIHGGGFLNGASSMRLWSGENLARRGVTVVSLNYRLGAFGFLAHPQAGTNFGLLDWVAALTWVAENIAAFGGDPNNVTVFGQSAGGAAARALLHTPSERGLFQRAVVQSAGYEDYAVVGSRSYQRVTTASQRLFDQLGSTDIAELRRVPAEQVRQASFDQCGINPPPGQVHTPANLVWYPTADGVVMAEDFAGWPADVPVMIGCTEHEGRFFVQPTLLYAHPELDPAHVYTQDTLAHMARALGGERAEDILAHYAASRLSPYEALADLITVAVWHEPALASAERFAALGRRAYHYRFARVSPGARKSGLLAKHSAEIPYLFGGLEPPASYDEIDAAVSDAVQHAWVEFARTGVPRTLDGTEFPRYDLTKRQVAVIDDATDLRPLDANPVTDMIHTLRTVPANR